MIIFYAIIGLISGIYHGFYNNQIYHNSARYKNGHEKVHTIWIHIVSGLVGSFCLYFLYKKFFFVNNTVLSIGIVDLVLLLFGLLGIVGLLPMTLWFIVLSTNVLRDLFLKLLKLDLLKK